MTSNSRRSRQEEFEDSLVLYGDQMPEPSRVRANMVATVDGSAVGGDGLTGSINTEIDRRTFQRLRASADVIVVGAGTARAEGYGPAVRPLVVVSASGALPDRLRDAPPERVRTEPGGDADALRDLVRRLYAEGCGRILVEGGPRLLGDLLRAGLVDEVCATVAPRLVAGDGARMVSGPDLDVPLELVGLIEEDGTLLCRWRVVR